MSKFRSHAQWPKGSISTPLGDDISTDDHHAYGMAESVCRALLSEGLGGQRKVFPIKTWVTDANGKILCENSLNHVGG